MRDLGNTVLVVEHDEETIRRADYVIDLGPGAGRHGGELVAHGTPEEIQPGPAVPHRSLHLRGTHRDRSERRQPNGEGVTCLEREKTT